MMSMMSNTRRRRGRRMTVVVTLTGVNQCPSSK